MGNSPGYICVTVESVAIRTLTYHRAESVRPPPRTPECNYAESSTLPDGRHTPSASGLPFWMSVESLQTRCFSCLTVRPSSSGFRSCAAESRACTRRSSWRTRPHDEQVSIEATSITTQKSHHAKCSVTPAKKTEVVARDRILSYSVLIPSRRLAYPQQARRWRRW